MINKATIMMNGMFTGDKIMNYSNITLGELLSSENETIKRNAISILKIFQKKEALKRLEYLRKQIKNECISYSEIAELQSLKNYIDKNDVLLLEWAGVKEK